MTQLKVNNKDSLKWIRLWSFKKLFKFNNNYFKLLLGPRSLQSFKELILFAFLFFQPMNNGILVIIKNNFISEYTISGPFFETSFLKILSIQSNACIKF